MAIAAFACVACSRGNEAIPTGEATKEPTRADAVVAPAESLEGAAPLDERVPVTVTGERPRLVTPLDDWDAILDPFGAPRGDSHYHAGVDFGLDGYPSSPVYAACDGRVGTVSEIAGYDTTVVVGCDHPLWTTLYGHLADVRVEAGDRVRAGDTLLGYSRQTEWGHEMLHFEVRWNLVPVDPVKYLDLSLRPSSTPTPGPTATPTRTPVPTPTRTSVAADDGEPTEAPPPTATEPPAPTPTLPPGTPTPTATISPTGTPTPTPTRTPVPTPTPRPPTPTPTPLPVAF